MSQTWTQITLITEVLVIIPSLKTSVITIKLNTFLLLVQYICIQIHSHPSVTINGGS